MEEIKLSENVATAFSKIKEGMIGSEYILVFYCGEQIVNETDYMIICKQTIVTNFLESHLLTL